MPRHGSKHEPAGVSAPQNATHRSGQEGYTLYIDGSLEILKIRWPPKESVQDIRNRTWHVVARLDTTSVASKTEDRERAKKYRQIRPDV